MRKLLLTTLALAAVLLAGTLSGAPPADAARKLKHSTAMRYAKRAATNHARHNGEIVGWDIVRGFRFERRKWVFVWYAELNDGRFCGAQLVTRFASQSSNKVVAYFRNEECS